MPAVGYGTWRCDPDKLQAAIVHALRVGYRHLDCAGLYRNEHIVGAAIKQAVAEGIIGGRGELFICSKLPPTAMEAALVEPTLRKTLTDLGVDYIDLYITHWPYAVDPANTISPPPDAARRGYRPAAYLDVWRAMEAAVDAGLVKALGCSNMTAAKLHALTTSPGGAKHLPCVIQVEMHPALAQQQLVDYCARHSIVVTCYCPLGSPGRPDLYRAPGDPVILTHPTVLAVAAATGKTPAQVVLRWAVQRGTAPLPRSTTLSRIEENFGVFGWELSSEAMAQLAAMDATKGSVGRIMKGDNFAPPGVDWHEVWDEAFDHAL